MVASLLMTTLVVQPLSVTTVSSAVLMRDVKFENIETLTEKAKNGKTRYAGNGSGFFVSADGDVLTNNHVVDGMEEVVVVCRDAAYRMHVAAADKNCDLALLRMDAVATSLDADIDFSTYSRPVFPALNFNDAGICEVGDTVYVIGFPKISLQGLEAKVTKGIVSSLSGFKGQADNFQMDAAIQPGNSGGPVVNDVGRLVGVSVASLVGGQNVNYAIKLDTVREFLKGKLTPPGGPTAMTKGSTRRMLKRIMPSAVLVLCYESGSRPLRFDGTERERNEARARFKKAVVYAKLLKVRREWRELKEMTDSMIKEFGECVGEDIKELNETAKKELGESTEK